MTITPRGYVMPFDYTGYYSVTELELRRQQERNAQREHDLEKLARMKRLEIAS
jgi:hypothetical protein